MAFYDFPLRKRAVRALDGAMILLVVLLVVQIWVLMASVESWLAGHHDVALPAALISGCLFGVAVALMALVRRMDRRIEKSAGGANPED